MLLFQLDHHMFYQFAKIFHNLENIDDFLADPMGVKNKLPKKNDVIENYLTKNQAKNKSFISNSKNGKHSKLEYKQVKKLDNYFIYEINPFTGRHHQIRVQLASLGSPIKGDLKYGAKRSNKDGSINLHAREITFNHPTKQERIKIIAPLPKANIWELIN